MPYDRFQNRVMFPIHDRGGKVVAFGGRALDPSAKAKYLNSPETELFHKGSLLFNHHRARKAGRRQGARHRGRGLCRRHLDDQGGVSRDGRAARHGADGRPMRPAVDDVRGADPVLRRRQGGPQGRLSRDRDRAAADRRRARAFKFALLPDGQDPDDLARSGGPEAIAEVISRAQPFAEMLFQREIEGQTFDTPGKARGLERRLRELTAVIATRRCASITRPTWPQRLDALFGGAPAGGPRACAASARRGRRGAAAASIRARASASPARRCRPREFRRARRPRGAARNRHPRRADRPPAR